MFKSSKNNASSCPICGKDFSYEEIEKHVNKCIFLNSVDSNEQVSKRKRSPSPRTPSTERTISPLKKPKSAPNRSFSSQKTSTQEKKTPQQKNADKGSTSTQQNTPSSSVIAHNNLESPKSTKTSSSFSFNTNNQNKMPLAKQLQPKLLEDFIGQDQVLGENSVLRSLLEKGDVPNMILWGPPGCGKTSLSGVIQGICKASNKLRFTSLCAATCGVKDVDNIVTTAKNQVKFGKRTILFMDEIHRFNKKQQDIFLLYVEKGDITLVGATTENPSFTINNALLSRCRVVVLQKLQPENLYEILNRAARTCNVDVRDENSQSCSASEENTDSADSEMIMSNEVIKWLADISDGDARIALTNLELVIQSNDNKRKILNVDDVKDKIKASHLLYDRKGEEHYNIISAMHKSIRGSNADAALYWTTRMILSGEDPLFIARRMVRAASEDIGNADPNALTLAISTMQGCHLLGMPESDVLLAQCAIYLARAPKSREAYSALASAKQTIKSCQGIQPSVPMHLRNAPTRLMKDLGYGKLAEDTNFTFMPAELTGVKFLP